MRNLPSVIIRFAVIFVIITSLSACSDRKHESPLPPPTGASQQLSVDSLASLKDSLLAQGLYDCCTQPGCDHCVLLEGHCDCFLNIKRSDPICGECFEGYKAGKGKLKLVSIPELQRIRERKGPVRSSD